MLLKKIEIICKGINFWKVDKRKKVFIFKPSLIIGNQEWNGADANLIKIVIIIILLKKLKFNK